VRILADITRQWPLHPQARAMMKAPAASARYHAVSMEFAAYLDDRYVEMRILTDAGKTVTIVCDQDSIFLIQRHIEQMGRSCPEISSWKRAKTKKIDALHGSDRRSYEAALWEGWPVSSSGV